MDERFTRLPKALEERARTVRLGPTEVPALLCHPDWERPAPVVLWMHGRTVHKELDAGRYLRWIRAGIATCAVDLPGHGQRLDRDAHRPERTLDTLAEMTAEIDDVMRELTGPRFDNLFDPQRTAIGGMSAGGMAALRRLCGPHDFRCAAVEGTTGSLRDLYFPPDDAPGRLWPVDHPPDRVAELDPIEHLDTWRPIPLLALHSEADQVVPFFGQRRFLDALARHYRAQAADPDLIHVHTWPETGAPSEHAGFGRVSNDAKNLQTDFLATHLRPP